MKAEKKIKTAWAVLTNSVSVYYTDGSVSKVTPKGAVYDVVRPPARVQPEFVIAFVEPRGKKTWVGRERDLYIATDSEILGCLVEGVVLWFDSLVKKVTPRGSLEAAIAQFEREVDGEKVLGLPKDILAGTDIRVLGVDFSAAAPGSSALGTLRIEKVVVHGQELRLDLKNPTGAFSGSVWIDLSTKKLLKAVRDGKQVFPE